MQEDKQGDRETEEYAEAGDFDPPQEVGERGKLREFINSRYFFVVAIILVSVISFSLGRISGLADKREPVRVINNSSSPGEVKGVSTSASESGEVVASKSGTKYHYPWCAGAKQISAKNKISFASIEAARAAGYSPASNCKGLK